MTSGRYWAGNMEMQEEYETDHTLKNGDYRNNWDRKHLDQLPGKTERRRDDLLIATLEFTTNYVILAKFLDICLSFINERIGLNRSTPKVTQ